jgi:hypothetical protein
MADHLDSVKSLARNYRDWAAANEAEGKHLVARRQERNADALEAIAAELENFRRISQPVPSSYGDLSDIPPELMKELAGIKIDDLEQQLATIIRSTDGEVQIDALLIELFRRFKVIQTRKFLQNKLWRMAQKGLVYSVPGRKGVYLSEAPKRAPSAFDSDLDDDVPF